MHTIHSTIATGGAVVLAAAMSLSLAGCDVLSSGDSITGSGQLVTETYDFADFTDIDVSSAFTVDVAEGDEYAVEVTVDDNIVENLDVKLDGKTLRISMKGPDSYRRVTQAGQVTMPALNQLKLSGAARTNVAGFASGDPIEMDLSGASTVVCSDLSASTVSLDLEGASTVTCTEIETGDATIDVAGASTVEFAGSGADIDANVEGASSLRLGDFAATNANVKLSGASNATINASGTLDVDIQGSSDLTYRGEPTLGEVKMGGDSTLDPG